MIRINKNLFLFSGLFVLLIVIVLIFFQKFFPLLSNAVYYCQSFINSTMIQVPQYLNLIPFILLFGFTAILGIKFLIFCFRSQSLKSKLRSKIIAENKNEKTVVIKSNDKFAFCFGIRRPKIYISTGLITKLTAEEIQAVFRHEQYHLRNRDTLTMFVGSILQTMFPFFPLIRDLVGKYRIEREIEADNFAIKEIGSSGILISALRKFLEFPTFSTAPVVGIADHDTLEQRINALLGKPYKRGELKLLHLFLTAFSFFLILGTIAVPVHAKNTHYEHLDVVMFCAGGDCIMSCTNQQNLEKLYSEMPAFYTPGIK